MGRPSHCDLVRRWVGGGCLRGRLTHVQALYELSSAGVDIDGRGVRIRGTIMVDLRGVSVESQGTTVGSTGDEMVVEL